MVEEESPLPSRERARVRGERVPSPLAGEG
jgi:hypothetical protein